METIILQRTGQHVLSFTGEELVSVATSSNNTSTTYSGDVGRSADVTVYRTDKGTYVAAVVGYTQRQGEHGYREATILDSLEALVAWIEHQAPLPLWARDKLLEELEVSPETR